MTTTIIDNTGHTTTSAGISEPDANGQITALTPTASKRFSATTRGRNAAARWLAERGFAPDGTRLVLTDAGIDGGAQNPPPAPTREAFLAAYRELLAPLPWAAANSAKLDGYMTVVTRVVSGGAGNWSPTGQELAAQAWKAIGCKGKPTLKALRALPSSEAPATATADVCLAIVRLDAEGDGGPGVIVKSPATYQDWMAAGGGAGPRDVIMRSNSDHLPEGARVVVAPQAAGAVPVTPEPGAIDVGRCVQFAAKGDASAAIGVVRQLVEPEPGWERALVAWPDSTEQFVDVGLLRALVPEVAADASKAPAELDPDASARQAIPVVRDVVLPATFEELSTACEREGSGVREAAALAASERAPVPYVVRLDDARYGGGPGTVIAVGVSLDEYEAMRTKGADGAVDPLLRRWEDPSGQVQVGARVDLGIPDAAAQIDAARGAPRTRTTVTPCGPNLLWVTIGDEDTPKPPPTVDEIARELAVPPATPPTPLEQRPDVQAAIARYEEEERNRPAWTRAEHLRTVWAEDECLRHDPDAERVGDAWRRLYGEDMPRAKDVTEHTEECIANGWPSGCACPCHASQAIATWDGGDAEFYLFPNGRVYLNACDGIVLYEVTDPAVLPGGAELAQVRADLAHQDPAIAAPIIASGVDQAIAASNASLREAARGWIAELAAAADGAADEDADEDTHECERCGELYDDEDCHATDTGFVCMGCFLRGEPIDPAAAYDAWREQTIRAVPNVTVARWTRLEDGRVAACVVLEDVASPSSADDREVQKAAIAIALRKRGAAWRAYLALNRLPAFRELLREHQALLAEVDVDVASEGASANAATG